MDENGYSDRLPTPERALNRAAIQRLLADAFLAREGCRRQDESLFLEVHAIPAAAEAGPEAELVTLHLRLGTRFLAPPADPADEAADQAMMQVCLEHLRGTDRILRLAACQRLGQLGRPTALDELRRTSTEDPDPEVRTEATRAMADLRCPRVSPQAFAGLKVRLQWGEKAGSWVATDARGWAKFDAVPAQARCRAEWAPAAAVNWRQQVAAALEARLGAALASEAQAIRAWLEELNREVGVGLALLLDGSVKAATVAPRIVAQGFACRLRLPHSGVGDATEVIELRTNLEKASQSLENEDPTQARQSLRVAVKLNQRAAQTSEMELSWHGSRIGLVSVNARRRTVEIKTFGGESAFRPSLAMLVPEAAPVQPLWAELKPIPSEPESRLAVFERVPEGCFSLAVGPLRRAHEP